MKTSNGSIFMLVNLKGDEVQVTSHNQWMERLALEALELDMKIARAESAVGEDPLLCQQDPLLPRQIDIMRSYSEILQARMVAHGIAVKEFIKVRNDEEVSPRLARVVYNVQPKEVLHKYSGRINTNHEGVRAAGSVEMEFRDGRLDCYTIKFEGEHESAVSPRDKAIIQGAIAAHALWIEEQLREAGR